MPAVRTSKHSHTLESLPPFRDNYCTDCGTFVRNKRDQERHSISHLDESNPDNVALKRPFKCPHHECNMRFRQKSAMVVHNNSAHTGQKPHVCPEKGCDQRYADPAGLFRHRQQRHNYVSPHARGPRVRRAKPAPIVVEAAPVVVVQEKPKAQHPAHTAQPVMNNQHTNDQWVASQNQAYTPTPSLSSPSSGSSSSTPSATSSPVNDHWSGFSIAPDSLDRKSFLYELIDMQLQRWQHDPLLSVPHLDSSYAVFEKPIDLSRW
ncbi:hypothetical protein HDZ31DRAFT_60647 [Schizophyllum fasciatum]